MAINISFGGANIKRPGAYSTVDTANMFPASAGGFKVLAYVGIVPGLIAQVETATVVGAVTTAGNATVIVTALGMPNSPKVVSVPVAASDTATLVAGKIITALQADVNVGGFFTVSGTGATVVLTSKATALNDNSMNISVANGTCVGLTNALTSVTTTAGGTSGTPVGTVSYFNNPVVANTQIAPCELLDLMQLGWAHGADLIAVSPVAFAGADTDWQNAIDLLGVEAIDGIVIASTAQAIQVKVDAHCTLMSSIKNRRERRAFYGHATGLTVSAITALQSAVNNELAMMASPGMYVFDATGAKVLKASNYLASAYAGLWAGRASQDPITYKYVKCVGLEKIYTGDDIETLLAGHIAPTEYVRNKGFRVVQGVTCSASIDLTMQELSVSSIKVEMSQTLRGYFEDKYVGKAGVDGIEVTMYNDLVSMLEGFKTAGLITAYTDAKVTKSGTAFILDWAGKPTLPINNFLMTTHLSL